MQPQLFIYLSQLKSMKKIALMLVLSLGLATATTVTANNFNATSISSTIKMEKEKGEKEKGKEEKKPKCCRKADRKGRACAEHPQQTNVNAPGKACAGKPQGGGCCKGAAAQGAAPGGCCKGKAMSSEGAGVVAPKSGCAGHNHGAPEQAAPMNK